MNSEKNSKAKQRNHKHFRNFCYDFVKFTGVIPVLFWLRPKVYRPSKNKNPKGRVIYMANHVSFIDPITVHFAAPLRRMNMLATKDLFNISGLARWFFTNTNCIEVDKDNFTISAFHDVVERLEDERAVMIFPEGQVNANAETILAFKSGATLMAYKANAPIVPVYLIKKTKWYERVRLVVGEPLYVRELTGDMPTMTKLNAVSDELRNREIALRDYFESLPIYQKLKKRNERNKESEQ